MLGEMFEEMLLGRNQKSDARLIPSTVHCLTVLNVVRLIGQDVAAAQFLQHNSGAREFMDGCHPRDELD